MGGQGAPKTVQDGGRAKRAERRHEVPSRPRRCDRIAIKREIRKNRETGRAEDHMLFIKARFPFIAKHRFVFGVPGITVSSIFAFPGDAKIALCWTYVGVRLGRRLGGVLERSWEVFGRPRRPQNAHKTPQNGHKAPQDATMTVQDGSKTRPKCSQDAPKTHSRRKLRQDVPLRPRNAKTLK